MTGAEWQDLFFAFIGLFILFVLIGAGKAISEMRGRADYSSRGEPTKIKSDVYRFEQEVQFCQ